MEAPSGAPAANQSVVVAGDSTGWKFIYPKEHEVASMTIVIVTDSPR